VRVGLFDSAAKTYIHNTAQVFADWDQGKEDVWSFPSGGIGPIMFRTHGDTLDKATVWFIFELVLYYRSNG
jgi:hypothetical protein